MVQLSRRALLRAAASATLVGFEARLLTGCDDGAASAAPPGPRPIEKKTLHVSLDGFPDDVDYTLDVGDLRLPLVRHTATSLGSHRASTAVLRAIPDDELTHYVDVDLPGDAPQSLTVSYAIAGTEMRGLALAAIHLPTSAISTGQAIKGASYGLFAPRRAKYRITTRAGGGSGLTTQDGPTGEDVAGVEDLSLILEEEDAARYLVFHHPDILSLDKDVAAVVLHHVDSQSPEMKVLAALIARLGRARSPDEAVTRTSWARGTYLLDPDGNKVPQLNEDGSPVLVDGRQAYQWYYAFPPEVTKAVSAVVTQTLRAVYDDPDLEDKRFHVEEARSSRGEPLPDGPPLLQGQNAASPYVYAPLDEGWTGGQCVSGLRAEGGARTVSFDVGNSYNRSVSVYCGFFDSGGKLLKRADIGADAGDPLVDTEHLQYLGVISPALWLLGVPVGGTVARERFTARIPDGATSLGVFVGSLSFLDTPKQYDERGKAATAGLVMTLVCELGIPTIALAYGALFDAGTTLSLKNELRLPVLGLSAKLAAAIYAQVTTGSAAWINLGVWAGNQALKLALAKAATAAIWGGAIVLGNVTRGIPIAGTALFAINAADTAQSVGRTLGGLAKARAVYTTEVRSTNQVRVRVKPHDVFGLPQSGGRYELLLVNKAGMSLRASDTYSFLTSAAGFDIDVPGVPTGGDYQAIVRITSSTGYVVGYGAADFVNIVPDGETSRAVECVVKNQPIPISSDTVYSTSAELAVVAGAHQWTEAKASPPGGLPDACGGGAERVCAPTSIGIDGVRGNVGYAWQGAERALPLCGRTTDTGGTSAYTMRNLNLNVFVEKGAPDGNLKDYACGELSPVVPLYALRSDKAYVLEASGGVYVLRELDLSLTGDADFRRGRLVARLASTTVRAAAIFDNRYAMIISGDPGVDRLEVVPLTPPASEISFPLDERLPRAWLRSGPGTLRGNVRGAVAVCQAYDGDVFLVLENGNKRLQAFGVTGEPAVDYFRRADGSRSSILELSPDREYLDVACEIESAAIYVVSRRGRSPSAEDYRLDIYKRTSPSVLATTPRFAAAKLALDTNQNIVSLGWNELLFRGRREPGLWRWTPSTP